MGARADFEARLTMVRKHPLAVGYRPQFHYEGEPDQGYLIFPVEWFTDAGKPTMLGDEVPPDCIVTLSIINSSLRDFHGQRPRVGAKFEWREGYRVVARGEVTRILSLSA